MRAARLATTLATLLCAPAGAVLAQPPAPPRAAPPRPAPPRATPAPPSSAADLAPRCAVTISRAPDDARRSIDRWVAAEPRCSTSLDVRVIPTEGGLYLFARDTNGRIHERIVPDAQSAGVLVASWVADDSVTWAPPSPGAYPSAPIPAPGVSVNAGAPHAVGPGPSNVPAPRYGVSGTDGPRTGVSGTDAPRTGVSGTDGAQPGVRGTDGPRYGVSGTDGAQPGVRGTDGPRYGVSGTDGPRPGVRGTDGPRYGVSGTDGPRPGVPGADGPRYGVVGTDGPRPGVPGTDGPRYGVSGTDGPQPGVPGTDGPQSGVPGTDGPRYGVSGTDGPQPGVPGTDGPRYGVAGTDGPRPGVRGTDGPRYGVAGTDGARGEARAGRWSGAPGEREPGAPVQIESGRAGSPKPPRWLTLATTMQLSDHAFEGGGLRGELDVYRRGALTLGVSLAASRSILSMSSPFADYSRLEATDLRAAATIARTFRTGRWMLRVHGGLGLVRTSVEGYLGGEYVSADGVFPVVEGSLMVGREMFGRWAVGLGPVLTWHLQDMSGAGMDNVRRDADLSGFLAVRRRL